MCVNFCGIDKIRQTIRTYLTVEEVLILICHTRDSQPQIAGSILAAVIF